MLAHLRRAAAAVAVVLVGLGFVVWDPNTPHAWASSCVGSSICSPQNAWVLRELATSASVDTAQNIGTVAARDVLNTNLGKVPTTPVPATAGRGLGFKMRGGGWAGALLNVASALPWDLILDPGTGVDPGTALPTDGTTPSSVTGYRPDLIAVSGTAGRITVTGLWSDTQGNYPPRDGWAIVSSVGVTMRCNGGGSHSPKSMSAIDSSSGGGRSGWTFTFDPSACGAAGVLDYRGSYDVRNWPGGSSNGSGVWVVSGTDPLSGDQIAREAVNKVKCKGPNGLSVDREASIAFTILGLRESGGSITVPEVSCPENYWAVESSPTIRTPQGGGSTGGQVTDTPLSAPVSPSQPLLDALPGLLAGTHLGLQLERAGVVCTLGTNLCRGWAADPERESKYQCKDDGVQVALERCAILEDAYEPDGKVGGQVDPAPEGAPANPDARRCWPTGWGTFNPFEWVYRPIMCAMQDLFVPTVDVKTQVQLLGQTASQKFPFNLLAGGSGGIFAGLPGGVGICPDWRIQVGPNFDENVVCDSSYTHAIVAGRPLLTGVMIAGAFAPLIRSLFYAVIPFVRPVPTS